MPLLFNHEQQDLVVNGSLEQEEHREQQYERTLHETTASSRSRARRAQSQVVDNEQAFGIFLNPLAFFERQEQPPSE